MLDALTVGGARYLPGGVSSPLRAFLEVGGEPVVVRSASGSRLTDVDGRDYVDFVCGLGPLILGHAHPAVAARIREQAGRGTVFGLSSEVEYDLAGRIVGSTPWLEQVRFVCSGTEAVMTAVRLARAYTGRSRVLVFRGCYHGHSDAMLGRRGPDAAAGPVPGGIPAAVREGTVEVEYNDVAEVRRAFRTWRDEIAAVLVEPIASNMGLVMPEPGFLAGLRECCDDAGALLVFDEVVTGFRLAYGSVSRLLGVQPDLVTFGKIVGGGLPVGAYGGRADVMALVAPTAGVFQGGTFAGNPLTMAAGIATLDELSDGTVYERLERLGRLLDAEFAAAAAAHGLPHRLVRTGSICSFVLGDAGRGPRDCTEADRQDTAAFTRLHRALRDAGYLLPPSVFEPFFLSAAHRDEDVVGLARTAAGALAAHAS